MVGIYPPIACSGTTHVWFGGGTTSGGSYSQIAPGVRCQCGQYRWDEARPSVDELIDRHNELLGDPPPSGERRPRAV